MKRYSIIIILSLFVFSNTAIAQKYKWKDGEAPIGKWYWKSSPESFNFSWGRMMIDTTECICSPRVSMFFNYGQWAHYNFNKKAGIITGAEIKNIGFSYLNDSVRFKARNYYIGVPLILKLGNIKNKNMILVGGGIDFAINYKQKYWAVGNRKSKVKMNEWFSDKTNIVNPYLTLGFMKKGYGIKLHYYLTQFYKKDIIIPNKTTYLPQNVNTNLFYASLLFDPAKGLKLKKK